MAGDDRPGVLTLERRQRLAALAAGDGDPREAAPGLAVSVLREGRMASAAAFGVRETAPALSLRPWTKMRTASISKLAAALGLLNLIDAGRINPDADVSAGLGFALRNPAFPSAPITLRHILAHTASLRDGEVYWGTLGEGLEAFFAPQGAHWEDGAHFAADAPPGIKTVYCNLGYGILASIMERAAGQRFDLLMQARVFAPLGLDCGYNWSGVPEPEIAAAATLYRQTDGAWIAQADAPGKRRVGPVFAKEGATLERYTPGENGLLFSPQGGLRASVLDLAVLGELILGRGRRAGVRIYSEASSALLLGPAPMGAQTLPAEISGRPLLGHGAEAYGLRGGLWLDPAQGAGFAYLLTGGPEARAMSAFQEIAAIETAIMAVLAEAAFG